MHLLTEQKQDAEPQISKPKPPTFGDDIRRNTFAGDIFLIEEFIVIGLAGVGSISLITGCMYVCSFAA